MEDYPGRLKVDAGGSIASKDLPSRELAPVGIEIHGKIATQSGEHQSALREAMSKSPRTWTSMPWGCWPVRCAGSTTTGLASHASYVMGAIIGSGVPASALRHPTRSSRRLLTLFNGRTSGGEARSPGSAVLYAESAELEPDPMVAGHGRHRLPETPVSFALPGF